VTDRLDRLIRGLRLDGKDLQGLQYDDPSRTWWVAVAVVYPDGREVAFDLEFQYVPGGAAPALVVAWVVVPPGEMRDGAAEHLPLLRALNDLNREPGGKFRLHTAGAGSSLVCEADLPADDLLTPELLLRAVERSRDVVAAHFDDVQALARP
jgi:hypothetical protein